ncbi:hypothetical protein Ahy_B08g094364 isoform A [Arachis hypogaea]|uniref:Uncharacterized protein n=1 Tax=Arachis hypogaea TaxID=3818 RepID=A0A444Y8S6_ARAHY|nr:hypothetical protein Ahy_B08g094364 isoform A [Arachis hypogaea]
MLILTRRFVLQEPHGSAYKYLFELVGALKRGCNKDFFRFDLIRLVTLTFTDAIGGHFCHRHCRAEQQQLPPSPLGMRKIWEIGSSSTAEMKPGTV